ncbi:MAG: divergent PAP2 family protein [Clostridia bacterium]|nr:divergent PAP2 family protein [Clostridia bacterium]
MNEYFAQLFTNKYLIVPILTWFFIQTFKVIWDLVTTKKFNFKRILGAGGMPSSHTAVVMSLSTLIGKEYGFNSPIFALSMVFAFVVMYDAAGVRRAAGKQATLLNKIVETPGLSDLEVQERLVEVLGHTPTQVIVGAIIGIIVGAIF